MPVCFLWWWCGGWSARVGWNSAVRRSPERCLPPHLPTHHMDFVLFLSVRRPHEAAGDCAALVLVPPCCGVSLSSPTWFPQPLYQWSAWLLRKSTPSLASPLSFLLIRTVSRKKVSKFPPSFLSFPLFCSSRSLHLS